MTLTCECCGHTETFPSAEDAYLDGWDHLPVTCSLCPRTATGHDKAHKEWAANHRPKAFSICRLPKPYATYDISTASLK